MEVEDANHVLVVSFRLKRLIKQQQQQQINEPIPWFLSQKTSFLEQFAISSASQQFVSESWA